MSESIVLDTPESINMWVLLSRRHQCRLHMKGIKVPGLVKAINRELGSNARTVKEAALFVEQNIAVAGGIPADDVNWQVMISAEAIKPVWLDGGVFDSMQAVNDEYAEDFGDRPDDIHMQATWDAPRAKNSERYMVGG